MNQNIALSSQFAVLQRRSVADVMHHNVVCSEVCICNVCGSFEFRVAFSLIVRNLNHCAWQFHIVAMHDRDFSLHFICICFACLQLCLQQHAFRSIDFLDHILRFFEALRSLQHGLAVCLHELLMSCVGSTKFLMFGVCSSAIDIRISFQALGDVHCDCNHSRMVYVFSILFKPISPISVFVMAARFCTAFQSRQMQINIGVDFDAPLVSDELFSRLLCQSFCADF